MSSDDERAGTRWLPIFLEAFFVVLGVVLALGANEWREAQERQQHADRALDSILQELTTNRQAVRESLTYHLGLVQALNDFAERTRDDPAAPPHPESRIFSKGYVSSATLLSTAWDTAAATDAISSMSYDHVLALSRAYQRQRSYEEQATQSGTMIYQRLFDEGHEGILRNYVNLANVLSTFWYRECQMVISYDQTLADLAQLESGDSASPSSMDGYADDIPQVCRYALEPTKPRAEAAAEHQGEP